jgi:hypothetical protein
MSRNEKPVIGFDYNVHIYIHIYIICYVVLLLSGLIINTNKYLVLILVSVLSLDKMHLIDWC